LDAFPLPDVLGLLASTKKAGELLVRGSWSDGRLWVRDGELVDAEAPRASSIIEALFELLRLEDDGSFVFDQHASIPDGPGQPIEPLLAEAQERLTQWRVIEAVVPSLDTPVSLAPAAPHAKVALTAEQWRIIVAIGSGGTVDAVAQALGAGEFGACAAVKALVDAGLVVVDGAGAGGPFDFDADPSSMDDFLAPVATPRPKRARRSSASSSSVETSLYDVAADVDVSTAVASLTAEKARQLAAELAELGTPGAEAVEAAAAAPTDEERAAALTEALTDEEGQPINRGLLLKFLSSVRS
jgi:hypothetical protein